MSKESSLWASWLISWITWAVISQPALAVGWREGETEEGGERGSGLRRLAYGERPYNINQSCTKRNLDTSKVIREVNLFELRVVLML